MRLARLTFPCGKECANLAGTDSLPTQSHLWNFIGKEAQISAHTSQQFDVALAIMAESKAAAEVNFFRLQTLLDRVAQKIFGADQRKLFRKGDDNRLLDAEHAKAFDLLIQSLQQRWRRFRMQYGSRMRIESDHRGHGIKFARSFDDCAHHQLMAQMQTIKDTERQHRRALDFSVVSSVK